MKKLKLFWKDECPNCPGAKVLAEKIELAGNTVEYFDVETPEGLAESSFYSVLSTPTLVITDINDNHINSWCGTIPSEVEIMDNFTR